MMLISFLLFLGKEPPNREKTPRFEQSVGGPFLEINIKQMDHEVVHLPVQFEFVPGQILVEPTFGIKCHSDMQTYTGWCCALYFNSATNTHK
jgi:hypothetical protein